MASAYTTIRLNDRGDNVRALQSALNAAGYDLKVDGVFGQQTLSAVKKYQAAQGLSASGDVDEGTWNALNGVSAEDAETPAYSDALSQLMNQFASTPAYNAKSQDELRQQAEGEYQSYYDQLRLAAQQQHQQSDLALQQQREGLQDTYDRQREDSARQYAQAYSQTDNALLGRGMQRSSYGAQTLANLLQEGAQAQQDIGDAQAAAQGNIDAQRTQLAQQLAAQLSQYDASQQSDILARLRELEAQEYDRAQTSQQNQNSLALQLYQAMYQEQRDKASDDQWQQQFAESVRQYEDSRKSSSSSSSSGGSKANTTGTGASTAATGTGFTYSGWQGLLAALNGGSSSNKQITDSVIEQIRKKGGIVGGTAGFDLTQLTQ